MVDVSKTGLLAGTIASKVQEGNEKSGSIQNKIKYSGKLYANLRKSQAKDAFVTTAGVAASVGAAAVVAKSKTAQNVIKKGVNAVLSSNIATKAKGVAKEVAGFVAPYAKKAARWVMGLPGPAKVVLGAGVVLTAIASKFVQNNYLVNNGKILKEMEVSAKLEKEQSKKAQELLS